MGLRANAELEFSAYRVVDDGVEFQFTCRDPGAGEANGYLVRLSDAELADAGGQVLAALAAKLQRKLRAGGIGPKLDGLVGQVVVL